jgi:ABC-type transport system involved in cytochrome c biogenesis permease component
MTMRNVFAVARKDLVIEWRARLLLVRVLPFALLVLVLFAVALDSEALLTRAAARGNVRRSPRGATMFRHRDC